MSNYKIIFTGPVGAGKTTAIAAISDEAPLTTDERASDMTNKIKDMTTVAFDYGTVRLEDGECIHLYGTPGQQRFDFMWDILTNGGIGLILLVDNTRPDPFKDLAFFISQFDEFIKETQLTIGVTQMDKKATPCIDDYANKLQKMGVKVPIFEVDARQRKDVSMLVKALLYSLDPCLA